MNDKFLLVGGSGRVGRMVVNVWDRQPNRMVRGVLQGRGSQVITNSSSLRWDPLQGSAELQGWVNTYGPFKGMVVLAGITPNSGQDLSLNKTIVENCLAAAKLVGISRVLVASSSAVYGIGDGSPFSEAASCTPVNEYGRSKLEMEHACEDFRGNDLEVCCLRIGNVAGADALLLNIKNSETYTPISIDIFADGRGPLRSYIGPKTLSMVIDTLVLQTYKLPSILNIAAPSPIHMDVLANAAGHPWVPKKPKNQSHQNISLDCSLISEIYPFTVSEGTASEIVMQWKDTLLL